MNRFTLTANTVALDDTLAESYRKYVISLRYQKPTKIQRLVERDELLKDFREARKQMAAPHGTFYLKLSKGTCTKKDAVNYIMALYNYITAYGSRLDHFDLMEEATGICKSLLIQTSCDCLMSNELLSKFIHHYEQMLYFVREVEFNG